VILGYQDYEAPKAILAHRDLLGMRAPKAPRVQVVFQDQLVQPALKGLLVRKGVPGIQVFRDLQVHRV
jgi:hypothetical protein